MVVLYSPITKEQLSVSYQQNSFLEPGKKTYRTYNTLSNSLIQVAQH